MGGFSGPDTTMIYPVMFYQQASDCSGKGEFSESVIQTRLKSVRIDLIIGNALDLKAVSDG